jgi:hypothetical protein
MLFKERNIKASAMIKAMFKNKLNKKKDVSPNNYHIKIVK